MLRAWLMFGPLLSLIHRLRLACLLLLALAALAPAVEAHACVEVDGATVTSTASMAIDEAPPPCPDCGQPCAGDCCHAPHTATVPNLSMAQDVPAFATPLSWHHSAEPPRADAGGPLRPPRP